MNGPRKEHQFRQRREINRFTFFFGAFPIVTQLISRGQARPRF
jgi:hypothetical protein